MEVELCCKNNLLSAGLTEDLYKCFAHIFDVGDDELVRDRLLSLHFKAYFNLIFTLIIVPSLGLVVGAYVYNFTWLYFVGLTLITLPLFWKCIYRWYILSAAHSFVYSAKNFDSCFSSVVTAIREREIISFGVLVNSTGEFRCCNRVLRIEILNNIRSFIRAYTTASEKLAQGDEKEKLLRLFFTDQMSELALSTEVSEYLLHLSSLKELFKLLSLVRSEYVRLLLFRLSDGDAFDGLKFFYGLRKFRKMQNNFKKRFTSAMKYIFLEEDENAVEVESRKTKAEISLTERAAVELGLALQILKKSNSEEDRIRVSGILLDVIDMIKPRKIKKVENGESKESELEPEKLTCGNGVPHGEEVYEGVSEHNEELQNGKESFYTKLQNRTPVTRALVNELKDAIGNRRKSNSSSDEPDVGFKIVLNKSSEDNSTSSSLQDSCLLSSTSSSDDCSIARPYVDSKLVSAFTSSSCGSLNASLLGAIRSRSNLPAANYGDLDED